MITLKQKRFAAEYALTGNGTLSATNAGYAVASSHVTASRLLKNANVTAAIDAELARLRERTDLRSQDVVEGLRRLAEDPDTPASARVQAWRLLGRNLGLFTDRVQVEHSLRVPELQSMRLDELQALRETMVGALPELVETSARVL